MVVPELVLLALFLAIGICNAAERIVRGYLLCILDKWLEKIDYFYYYFRYFN